MLEKPTEQEISEQYFLALKVYKIYCNRSRKYCMYCTVIYHVCTVIYHERQHNVKRTKK